MERSPVGSDEAFEADLVAQNRRQRILVAAGERAIDAVVGAHDRGDVGLADGSVEWRHIDLVQRLVVDVRAAAVGVVAHIVLDLRHHMLRLNALDLGHTHLRGEEWILAEGVVPAPEFQVSIDVDKGLQ